MIITIHRVNLRSVQTPAAAPCCSTCHVAGMWRWRVVWTTCSLSHVSRWPGSPSRGTLQGDRKIALIYLYRVTTRLCSKITFTLIPINFQSIQLCAYVWFSAALFLRQCPRWRWEEDPCTQSRWRRSYRRRSWARPPRFSAPCCSQVPAAGVDLLHLMHSKQESEQCEQFSIFWDTCREEIDLLKFVIFHSIFRDGYKFDGTIPVHYWRLGTPRTHRKESSNNLYICHLYQTKYLLLTHNSKCIT